MDPSGILTTSAEISIAIAGFSGIVLALGPGRTRGWSEASKFILSVPLLTTAATVVFSFVPLLIFSAKISESTAWAASSSLHVAYFVGVIAFRINQTHQMTPDDQPGRAFYAFAVIASCVVILQFVNAIWLQTAWPFFVAIVAMNLAGFIAFSVLLWMCLVGDPQPGNGPGNRPMA